MVIYKTTNLVNGKQYIGRDSHNNPNYLGSGTLLKKAIKKYGKENFKKEILESCETNDELVMREEYWLNYYDAGNNPLFYNLHNKSIGCGAGEQHPFYGKRGNSHPNFGRKHSKETRNKMSLGQTGKIRSEETRKKMGDSNRGEKHYLYGKSPSDETRMKLSEARTGEKNHMYGKRGESAPRFRGYVVCVDGNYIGIRKTVMEWCETLNVIREAFAVHLSGKKYKNGIKGNFFKWEDEL